MSLCRLRPPFAAGSLARAALTASTRASAVEPRLRIQKTTAIHMNLLAWGDHQNRPRLDHGLAKTITLIKATRAEAKNSLLFDNGAHAFTPCVILDRSFQDEAAATHKLKVGAISLVPPQILQ